MSDLRKAAQSVIQAWDDPVGTTGVCRALDTLRAALAEPVQEPEGYFSINDYGRWEENESEYGTPLYAAWPQRKPLTDGAYRQLMKHAHRLANDGHGELAQYLRDAIDIAHGIGVSDEQ